MFFKYNSYWSKENEGEKFYEMFIGLARIEYYMSTIAIVTNLSAEISYKLSETTYNIIRKLLFSYKNTIYLKY